jgi:hypothetical protein
MKRRGIQLSNSSFSQNCETIEDWCFFFLLSSCPLVLKYGSNYEEGEEGVSDRARTEGFTPVTGFSAKKLKSYEIGGVDGYNYARPWSISGRGLEHRY